MKWQIYSPQHLVVKNGNFTFLLLDLPLAVEVADLPLQMSIDPLNGTDPLNTTTLKLADQPPGI